VIDEAAVKAAEKRIAWLRSLREKLKHDFHLIEEEFERLEEELEGVVVKVGVELLD